MAKLYFRYGAMNSGKSTALMQVAHNYEEQGMRVLILKPKVDTKGSGDLVSRLGVRRPADLLVLDEAGSAEELEMVDVGQLKKAVLERPAGCECVLTAHTPPQWMLDAADYSTEMKCHRHPYQKGIKARKGIEY